jgi:hypothetical protein
MIDSSIFLLWEDHIDDPLISDSHEDPYADYGRARRIQVLMAEARAGGTPWTTIARILLDWIGVVYRHLPRDPARHRLDKELGDAEEILSGTVPPHTEAAPHPMMAPAALDLARIAFDVVDTIAYHIKNGTPDDGDPGAVGAWMWSVETLAIVHQLGGKDAIDKCANLAYARLFPRTEAQS